MKDKLHVLIFPSWYPIGTDNLMGNYHIDYAKAMSKIAKTGMMFVETMPLKRPGDYFFNNKFFIDETYGIKVYIRRSLNTIKISHKVFIDMYYRAALKLFKKYIKDNGMPDIIHAEVAWPAGYAAAKIGKKYGIKVIVTEHSSQAIKYFQKPIQNYTKFMLENATYTSVSKAIDEDLKEYTKIKYHIPNGVNEYYFNSERADRKPSQNINLVQVTALRKGKGFFHLMDALNILKKEYGYTNIHLYIIGAGYSLNELKNAVQNKSLEDNISFIGQLDKEEILKYFEKADMCVISSEKETFAIPGLEALAAGCPLVTTKCGGPEEYTTNETGEYCELKDAADMARAIDYVYKNYKKYKVKNLQKAAEKFKYSNIVKEALKLYKEILKNTKM